MNRIFSWSRWTGVLGKEFIQLKRDRLTFAMIVGIPVIQLVLFGFAINSDPKHLPAAVRDADRQRVLAQHPRRSQEQRVPEFRRARRTTTTRSTGCSRPATPRSSSPCPRASRERSFAASVPRCWSRPTRPIRRRPATRSPPSTSSRRPCSRAISRGPSRRSRPAVSPFEVRVHPRYNPEAITQYNIVPGLMGVILTMTMVLMTGLAITRETERGTMENLLATPASPLEVMTGKIVPYVLIGLVQVSLILLLARVDLPRADPRPDRRAVRRGAPVHRREPDARPHVLVARAEPAAGDADDVLLLPALDPAVGLHVSVPRDARLGAGDRRGAAAHPFPARRPRRPAQGQRHREIAPSCGRSRCSCSSSGRSGCEAFRRTLD